MQVSLVSGIFFFWAGYVCAISFMESWLKFRAKGVSLAVGVSIGSKVFTALNRVEWFFFSLILLLFVIDRISNEHLWVHIFLLFVILAVQTAFLLPSLVRRANLIIEGQKPGKTRVHIVYVVLDVLKIVVLVISGLMVRG